VIDDFGQPIGRLFAAGELGAYSAIFIISGGRPCRCFVGGWTAGRAAPRSRPGRHSCGSSAAIKGEHREDQLRRQKHGSRPCDVTGNGRLIDESPCRDASAAFVRSPMPCGHQSHRHARGKRDTPACMRVFTLDDLNAPLDRSEHRSASRCADRRARQAGASGRNSPLRACETRSANVGDRSRCGAENRQSPRTRQKRRRCPRVAGKHPGRIHDFILRRDVRSRRTHRLALSLFQHRGCASIDRPWSAAATIRGSADNGVDLDAEPS